MSLFFDLLPMMLGAALAPIWIVLVLLILKTPNGLMKAIAFVAGVTLMRLLQGIVFGYVINRAVAGENGASPAMSMLLIVLGILLLIAALKSLLNEADPDAHRPSG